MAACVTLHNIVYIRMDRWHENILFVCVVENDMVKTYMAWFGTVLCPFVA